MKIKKLKIKLNKDNEYSDYRYFIPKSNNIKMIDGRDVDEAVQSLKDKITNLKAQANYLIDKAPLVKYAEGTSITITDCAEAPLRKFSIEGDSYQETREGYNKLKLEDKTISVGGVEAVILDGKITINGTPETVNFNQTIGTETITEAGTYSLLPFKSSTNANIRLIYKINNGAWASGDNNPTFELAVGDILDVNLRIDSTATITNFTMTPMLTLGTEEKPYEQYGASPSIEYESPIESVGDNINLFNKDNATILNAYFTTSNTISSKSGGDTMIILPIEKNTTYAISKILELNSPGNVLRVGTTTEYPAYGVTLNQRVGSQGGTLTETMITTSDNDNYLVAFVHSNRTGNVYSQGEILASVKISKGTSTGVYSPYGQGSVEIKQFNANLLNMANAKGGTSAGITCTVNNNGSYSYVGTATNISVNVWFLGVYSSSDTTPVLFTLKAGTYYIKDCRLYNKTSRIGGTKAGEIITLIEDTNITGVRAVNAVVGMNYNETLYPIIAFSNAPVDFIQHQSQTKALYTQQPFRAIGDVKDRFIKQNGVWYEEHSINRKIYKGTETFGVMPNSNKLLMFINDLNDIGKVGSFCNMLKSVNNIWNLSEPQDVIKISDSLAAVNIILQDTEINTIDLLKEKLTTLYNMGTPLYVDYILKTPTLIPCTAEQIEILDNLQTYDKITYYNVDKINNIQANIKLIYKQDINAILEEKGV